ncbi:hypothetical protein HH303_15990 [Rhodospirillaceae bacterium KN72]|uniref:Uncharacterized protein n=1 Tax=Pacificispira spongiicola TaxID=2729598 RepID=A0A7Y0HI00_9PROT|nr:hypothetical protein [Pacificispira spongiicola]NMM45999.1 hypothetical protein [Pacificispira spongiicola]
METIEHPHIAEVRRELVYETGRWRHMMVVITDLSLDPSAPDHDAKTLNEVIQTVAEQAIANKSGYHGIVVRNP